MMNKKDKSSGSLEEKGNHDISTVHPRLKETADAAVSFAASKNEASVKVHGPVDLLRSKLGQLMGGRHGGASYEPGSAKPDKASLHPDMPEQNFRRSISKIDAFKGGRKKVMSPDINSLSERLSELEEHTREMHAKFDEFVLKSEKFMDYGQFIEVRKEVEEKIRLLDKIEKSLDDSRNQILKDSGYMDSILGGFKYTKERIEILEKQMDSLLKAERAKSHPSILNKIRGAVDPQNIKSMIDSSKLSGLGRTVLELKKQMDALKESESNALKEVERLKKERHVYDKNTDNNLPETVKSLNKEIGELKERVAGYPDRDELAMMKEQTSEFAVKFDELNKRQSEGVKGEDAEKEIKTAMSELKKEVDLKVDALRRAQNSVGRDHVAEFEKKQDELKDEMAKLKRDIRQIPAMQSSMEQISLAVNSLREDIRKDVDSKSMQSIDRSARDDDIAEVRGNIEKLKAMSQDL